MHVVGFTPQRPFTGYPSKSTPKARAESKSHAHQGQMDGFQRSGARMVFRSSGMWFDQRALTSTEIQSLRKMRPGTLDGVSHTAR
jgi:hypothetical protein